MFGILRQVQGWIKVKGGTDGTMIGNSGDSMKAAVTSSALPTGAATETTLSAINTKLNSKNVAPGNGDAGLVVRPISPELPTFSVVAIDIPIANNKSMIAIQNTGTSIVRIREIWIINDRTTAVAGVVGTFQANRITSFSGGTVLTPVSYDTADALPAGISVATGATVAGEGVTLRQGKWSTDEWGTGTLDTEALDHALQQTEPFWKQTPNGKALTIRQNQGLHIKFATNSTNGDFNIRLVFTVE
jgi:hypothetical protein